MYPARRATAWDAVFASNVRSIYLMCRAFLPPMYERGDGDVVNLASVTGKQCRAFVFSSGAWVYGDTGPAPVDESFPTTKPHRSSARRARFEQTLLSWTKEGRLPVVIARPGMVYGEASLWKKLYLDAMRQKKRAMMPGDGENRVSFVAKDYRVLLMFGDNLGDFTDKYKGTHDERMKFFTDNAAHWGHDWFMLPDPEYGSWESNPFNNNYKLSPDERRKMKIEALEPWKPKG